MLNIFNITRTIYNRVNQKSGDFINGFYNDMQWMGLAMLRTYEYTDDKKFKTTTRETLWPDIKGGWTSIIDGGIMWDKHTPNSKIYLLMVLPVF